MFRTFLHKWTLVAAALLTAGCSGSSFDLASTPVLQIEPPVTVAYSPQVYVHPAQHAERPYTAVFLPFRMQQAMDHSSHYGREVARLFYQTWLSQKLFPVMEFEESISGQHANFGQSQAVAIARSKGADLAITGRVTRLLAGGSVGKSEVAIRLEIYDARSGQLVWSMAHSGSMESIQTHDYLVFFLRNNLPADPVYAITASIARNMAIPMQRWLRPTPEQLAHQRQVNQANATDGTLLSPNVPASQQYLYGSEVRQPVEDGPPPPPPSLL
ncbi:hypothetical protein [Megalodesulfovibrio gigas]|uniref:Lipoprotein n=1 Tax=Megalodesulfovibrio gigas (strain ATCC 19364 / DSM 1382 / NCIMB 9332 / VKM B-1759) TaxID=1121448 RepID=T2GEM0_MEGG1|nr:hypothetical protein [Megalodesulfovibrio gigas]AGW14599.1 hypothetical protein DGI_2872 [Megalodesulfovibrio gigas DSM 1382 = ATCC 19364]